MGRFVSNSDRILAHNGMLLWAMAGGRKNLQEIKAAKSVLSRGVFGIRGGQFMRHFTKRLIRI